MVELPRRVALLGGVAAALLLLLAAPSPAEALEALRRPPSGSPTEPVVALGSLLAWALTGWLLLTAALTAGAQLPGAAGRGCRGAVRLVAPATLRRGVEVALGLSVVVGAVGASPAAAGPAAPAPAAAGLDWSAPAPDPAAADLDWAAASSAAAAEPVPSDVVVAPGDSLWAIAERDLAARRGSDPPEAEVAQAWPAWWAANRDTVGDDPHLIRPGIRLEPPSSV